MEENVISLEPIWRDNYTAIAMSSSDEYIPYLSVCLQSLVEHSSQNHNYDIIIFSTSNNENYKNILIDHFNSNNISIRFFNPIKIFNGIELRITHDYFNEACYYRVAAPLVFKKYKKIIYTDIDLIFQADIKKLYEIDLGDHPLAACKEPIWEAFIKKHRSICGIDINEYAKNTLKLKDINTYYNTGVVLFNLDEFNKNNYTEQLLELINSNYLIYQEQCAFNLLLNDKILPLDSIWNGEVEPSIIYEYFEAKNVNILHYLGRVKPWRHPASNLASLWWNYARRTPFYEIILQRMSSNTTSAIINARLDRFKDEVQKVFKYRRIILKYWKCKFLYKFSLGKKKEHYKNKKELLKNYINTAKTFRR